ncbi:SDR family NAD(P)-dependent oxidoreductase [Candidatus Protochlamydia phocaeensis]|uniref:SDR family NAD(P)-dependent oxidoreductase n=1 Tax=Candidatus Protochlamydia phocaeensis TaxID=1414722 RepID=UPI0008392561|nr:SDR family NAD(P)-dependent oxidoreductase [Candidatus Protochlamydia phocaeensis]
MGEHLALVTGATSGIGQALCALLANKGMRLLITGRDADKLQQLQERFPSAVLQWIAADLSHESGRSRVIEAIHRHGPDLVINNAGFGLYGEALTYQTEEQKKMVNVNCLAVIECALEAARTLVSRKQKGIILNVSSAAGFQIAPNMAIYAASKAFVTHFSQSFDEEMRPYGIRVLAICPGMVDTPFSVKAGGERKPKQTAGVMTPEFVAEEIWQQIHTLQPVRIIDWKYRLLTRLSSIFPKRWTAQIIKKNIAERIAPRHIMTIEQ